MAELVRPRAKTPKSGQFRNRNQKHQIRNQFSPVMQKVRDLLPEQKRPAQLHFLTEVPLSTCQKMVAGLTPENLELVTGLLRSDYGREILFALMGDARPDWFVKYRRQLDVIEANRSLRETQRKVDALQSEVFG